MSPESTPKGERAQQIIRDAAYSLIMEQGFAATSMRQISQRAGLALGGIYNHYASKEAIFEAIILEYHPFHHLIPLLKNTTGDTVEEFFGNAARRMVEMLQSNPDFLNLILIEFIEFKGKHTSTLFQSIFPGVMEVGGRLTKFQDQLRPIPTPMLMRTFLSLFFAYFITEKVLAGTFPTELLKNSFASYVDIYLHGVIKPDIDGENQ
jgi:AcrR family transcriptional regulator